MPGIDHHTALCDYLAMGADRSLAKLHRHYLATASEKPPCLRTLASWSTRYGWAEAVTEHDDFVGAALRSRLRETAVQDAFDRVGALTIVAHRSLDAVIEKMSTGEVTVATASDIKALVSSAIDAIRMCEVLTGGVSDREERRGGMAEEALMLLREIGEQKRQYGSSPLDAASVAHRGRRFPPRGSNPKGRGHE